MEGYNIYKDIANRTQGDIYVGVVGPVRTGKSTFIKNFMDLLVLPNIENEYKRERAMDELPQSAAGRMIMTTEPKFIPNEAVEIALADNANFRMRMIDCVGYIVDGAMGHLEDNLPRMVKTPWFEHEIPFTEAAELGTKKVITDHSTIGIVVTTDGSVTEIGRDEYLHAEERVIDELKRMGKPFMIVLNTVNPYSEHIESMAMDLEEKYGVSVLPLNCRDMTIKDVNTVMETILFEFPLKEIGINIPKWIDTLESSHWLRRGIREVVASTVKGIHKIKEANIVVGALAEYEHVAKVNMSGISLGDGKVSIDVSAVENLFYKILGERSGFEVNDDEALMRLMCDLSQTKREHDKVAIALQEVAQKGYGIVSPTIDELTLSEPEIVKQGNRFGVRLKASAPSIHMIRADIETEVSKYKMKGMFASLQTCPS
ncbi:MAG: stage IV sporulation protein A [Oscillospiraceae bacterium]|nr:stage IV sporulation protein A [Oscillospiraceae bacterium]